MPIGARKAPTTETSPLRLIGPPHQTAGGVWVVDSEYEIDRLRERLMTPGEVFGLDTETVGVNPRERSPATGDGRIVVWSCAYFDDSLGTNPVSGHPLAQRVYVKNYGEAEEKRWLHRLRDWFEGHQYKKVGSNFFGYDRHIFRNHGIDVRGLVFDTVRASRLNDPSAWDHDLKTHGAGLGYVMRSYGDLFSRPYIKRNGEEGKQRVIVPLTEVVKDPAWLATLIDYASLDAKVSLEEYPVLAGELANRPWRDDLTMLDYYNTRLHPYYYVLNGIEHEGCDMDLDYCREQAEAANRDLGPLERKLVAWAGAQMNFGSTKQLGHLLYGKGAVIVVKAQKEPIIGHGLPLPPVSKSKSDKRPKPWEMDEYDPSNEEDPWRPTDDIALGWLKDHVHSKRDKEGLAALLEWKKILSIRKYLEKLPLFTTARGKVHCQIGPDTETGRLAARNPPLQQIPTPGKDAIADRYMIREAFVCEPGYVLIDADYSQLEMRILAHYLMVLFEDMDFANDLASADLHAATAVRVFGKEEITVPDHLIHDGKRIITSWSELEPYTQSADDKDWKWLNQLNYCPKDTPAKLIKKFFSSLRNKGKIVNFSINYGKTAMGLGSDIRDEHGNPIGKEAAQVILDAYFAAYPAILRYGKWAVAYAYKRGYARTLGGRYRPLPGIRAESKGVRGHAERQAKNTPIQGSAADVVTEAQLRCNTLDIAELRDNGYYHEELARMGVRQTLQVHDEILFKCPKAHAKEASVLIKHTMENALERPLKVPLPVDPGIGMSWYEAH